MNETLKRLLSGAIYVILLLASIEFSTSENLVPFYALFGFFLIIATYEFCKLVKINSILPILIALITFSFFYKIATASKEELLFFDLKFNSNFDLGLLFITLLVSLKSLFFLFDKKVVSISSFSKYLYVFGYVILPFIFITKIPFGSLGYNPKIIISIFILIWTNDTFAYIVGKSVGKTKLFETVSPKKTIEGFLGGVFFAIIASYFISRYYIEIKESNIYIWVVTAIIIGVFGTLGDLIESKFKRVASTKDSGKIMPGHGGVLDRLDSVIFVAPIIYLFYKILYYVS